MRLTYVDNRIKDGFILEGDEFRHITKVLRLREGDAVHAIDGNGEYYHCTISLITKRTAQLEIKNTKKIPPRPYRLTIAIANTKQSAKLEWFVEKAIEIGVSEIQPMVTKRTEKPKVNSDRLQKIAISALKQSGQGWATIIHPLKSFEEVISQKKSFSSSFIASVPEKEHLLSRQHIEDNTIILIGPEGGFTNCELGYAIKHQFIPVSLGDSRLRTETAGVVSCQIVKTWWEINHY